MSARKLAGALVAGLSLAGCTHSEQEGKTRVPARARSGEAVVEKAAVGAVWVGGDRLHGLPSGGSQKLSAPISTTFAGTLSPAAVSDPAGGDLLVYNAMRGKRPALRLHDSSSRNDSLLDEGAFSLAWRRDGALAYFKALEPDVRDVQRYLGHVVVRRARDSPALRWSRAPGRYVVAAWAQRRLVVYRIRKGWPDLLVLDGPGRSRLLARASALVAVSPDGRWAFVARYGASAPVELRVLDVARGSAVASATLRRGPIRWVVEAGSWSGDRVVAAASAGLAVFRVRPPTIALEQVVRLPVHAFPAGVYEPQVRSSGERVVAWGELPSRPREAIARAAVLECDRLRLRCAQGPPVSSAVGPHLVYNPSRP